jgi:hypothetical protein
MVACNTPPDDPAYRDRSGRLAVFGLVTVLLGGASIMLGLLNLALPFTERVLPAQSPPAYDARTLLIGFFTDLLIGALLVWAGVGALRKRRWAPPVMLTIAWTWLIGGVFLLLILIFTLDELLTIGGGPLAPEIASIVQATILVFTVLAGVLLPAIYILVFRDEAILRTCERHDPHPSWAESCPQSVLGLSLVLWAAAALLVPLSLRPSVPLFGVLVTGWPGAALMLLGAAVSAWLARGVYRRSPTAWWATTVLLVLLGVSATATLQVLDAAAFYEAAGIPVEPGSAGAGWKPVYVWSSVVMTVLSVVYMLAVRPHFTQRSANPFAQT